MGKKSAHKTRLNWLSLWAFVMLSGFDLAWAQEGARYGDEIGLSLGHMLPNQIDGVTEILPVFGARYGLSTVAGVIEFAGMNIHAHGVDFTTAEVSLRGEVPVESGLSALLYAGVDLNWYAPENTSSRQTETGAHLGAGGLLHVANTLWLRGELKFMASPGTSLYLLFGLTFRGPPGQ